MIITLPPGAVCFVAISVCLSVCLSAWMSQEPHLQSSWNFLPILLVSVPQSSSDDSAIRYVVPVLWLILCFQVLSNTDKGLELVAQRIIHFDSPDGTTKLCTPRSEVCYWQFPCWFRNGLYRYNIVWMPRWQTTVQHMKVLCSIPCLIDQQWPCCWYYRLPILESCVGSVVVESDQTLL